MSMKYKPLKRYGCAIPLCVLLLILSACQNAHQTSFDEARDTYKNGQFDHALEQLSQLIDKSPKALIEQRAWFIKGKCYLALSKYELAYEAFKTARNKDATNYHGDKAHYKMVTALFFQGKVDEAMKGFKKISTSASIMRGEAAAMLKTLE